MAWTVNPTRVLMNDGYGGGSLPCRSSHISANGLVMGIMTYTDPDEGGYQFTTYDYSGGNWVYRASGALYIYGGYGGLTSDFWLNSTGTVLLVIEFGSGVKKYTSTGGAWTSTGTVISIPASSDYPGAGITVSKNELVLCLTIMGTVYRVHTYDYSGGNWVFRNYFTLPTIGTCAVCYSTWLMSMSLNYSGDVLVWGDGNGNYTVSGTPYIRCGAVRRYVNIAGVWSASGNTLLPLSPMTNGYFGWSVDLDITGQLLIVSQYNGNALGILFFNWNLTTSSWDNFTTGISLVQKALNICMSASSGRIAVHGIDSYIQTITHTGCDVGGITKYNNVPASRAVKIIDVSTHNLVGSVTSDVNGVFTCTLSSCTGDVDILVYSSDINDSNNIVYRVTPVNPT